jgi:hypothetical protein
MLDPTQIAELRHNLETIHELLLFRPGKLSLATAGPALQQAAAGLQALHLQIQPSPASLTPEERLDITTLLNLSSRVGALYAQASAIYDFGAQSAQAVSVHSQEPLAP